MTCNTYELNTLKISTDFIDQLKSAFKNHFYVGVTKQRKIAPAKGL
jgi:hypothetical protein